MKSVFITGGTTGIGAELAKLYLADGYRVGVCGRSREKFESSFGNVENLFFYELDVSDKDKTASVINEFCHGHSLDILYANAGIGVGHKGRLPDFNKYQKVLDINLNGFLYTVEPAFKIMNQQGYGHIIAWLQLQGSVVFQEQEPIVPQKLGSLSYVKGGI
jgi:NADP-dependent 3-hydroxy acid dehydrogenase YdfG